MLVKLARYTFKFLPDASAAALTRFLSNRLSPLSVAADEREALAVATPLYFKGSSDLTAWSWGEGPLILFVHGWGGSAAQMAPLARRVAELGFRTVVFNVAGHGALKSTQTRWKFFIRDVAAVTRFLRDETGEDIYAYVGHSAGALTMMAARQLCGLVAQRFVCVSAPSYPFVPIDVIRRRLNPRPGVLTRYQHYLAAQFEMPWQQLQSGFAFTNVEAELLLIYDEADRIVPHTEGDRIRELCAHAQLIKTRGHSHHAILSAPELFAELSRFLRREAPV